MRKGQFGLCLTWSFWSVSVRCSSSTCIINSFTFLSSLRLPSWRLARSLWKGEANCLEIEAGNYARFFSTFTQNTDEMYAAFNILWLYCLELQTLQCCLSIIFQTKNKVDRYLFQKSHFLGTASRGKCRNYLNSVVTANIQRSRQFRRTVKQDVCSASSRRELQRIISKALKGKHNRHVGTVCQLPVRLSCTSGILMEALGLQAHCNVPVSVHTNDQVIVLGRWWVPLIANSLAWVNSYICI